MGPIHYLFKKKFIPSPSETRALQNIELPEEERAGEDLASKRILEWIAFGGERLHKTGFHNARRTGKRVFLREFYWDLWKDIKHLREEALEAKASATYLQVLWKKYKTVGNI